MTNSSINRLTTLSSVVFLLVLALAGSVLAQADASRNPKITSRSVHIMATGAVVPSAGSTLFRTKAGVYFDFHTSSLTPGDAVTAYEKSSNASPVRATLSRMIFALYTSKRKLP